MTTDDVDYFEARAMRQTIRIGLLGIAIGSGVWLATGGVSTWQGFAAVLIIGAGVKVWDVAA